MKVRSIGNTMGNNTILKDSDIVVIVENNTMLADSDVVVTVENNTML